MKDSEKMEFGASLIALCVREQIMRYFKGDNIPLLIGRRDVGVYVRNLESPGHYYSDRREAENRNAKQLLIGDVPVCKVMNAPASITIYDAAFENRPKEFTKIREEIVKAAGKYLMGVKLEHTDDSLGGECTRQFDKEFLLRASDSLGPQTTRNMYSYEGNMYSYEDVVEYLNLSARQRSNMFNGGISQMMTDLDL